MPSLEEIQTQIKQWDSNTGYLSRKEVKELPKILHEKEVVQAIIEGKYNEKYGILVATNQRILFVDKGIFSLKVEDFSYDKISSIQYELGILFGSITIFASGNRAYIDYTLKTQTRNFAEFARGKINNPNHQVVATPPPILEKTPNKTNDMIDQLERLSKLRDSGILSTEEFAEQKKRILDSTN